MKKFFSRRLILRAAALLLITALSLSTVSPALALDLNPADYFQITFNPTAIDKSEATAGEPFQAVIAGNAVCTQDLPLPIGEIYIASQVIARPSAGGPELTLNPECVISINPLPNNAGESFEINQQVELQFPVGAAPGDYTVIGDLLEAKVKASIVWIDVTGSFPDEEIMGAVKCVAPADATPAATAIQPSASTMTAVTSAPVVTLPATKATLDPGSLQAPPKDNDNTFTMTLLLALGVGIVAFGIAAVILLMKRGS